MIHNPKRVEAIRESAANGLKTLSSIEMRVTGEVLLEQLHRLRSWFGDVETHYLVALTRDLRTPDQESTWLENAEMHLRTTNGELKQIFAKYPPDTKMTAV
jgi:hypothetical protein